jgi:hypothetical protein
MKKLMMAIIALAFSAQIAQAVVITGGKESIIIMQDGKPVTQANKQSVMQDIKSFFNEFIKEYKSEIGFQDKAIRLPANDGILATYQIDIDKTIPGGPTKKVTIYKKKTPSGMVSGSKEVMLNDISKFFDNLAKKYSGAIQFQYARGTLAKGEEIASYKSMVTGGSSTMGRPMDMVSVRFIEVVPAMELQKPNKMRAMKLRSPKNGNSRMMNGN